MTIHDVPKVKEGLLRAEPSNKVARHMVEVCDIAIEQDKHIRRLTAALRATPLVKCAEFMELAGMGVAYDPTELNEAAAALRALAETGDGDEDK